jgi:hypothetical protein
LVLDPPKGAFLSPLEGNFNLFQLHAFPLLEEIGYLYFQVSFQDVVLASRENLSL